MEIKDKRFANCSQYYIICVCKYSYCGGQTYQILNDINKLSNFIPYYCDYKNSYYKFDNYQNAYNKAVELKEKGVLPNLPISDKIAEYKNIKGVISILQRPMGDIVGERYAKYLEANKDNDIINLPPFVKGDIIFLTNIEDGNIIYKTMVTDCELNGKGEWQYYTTYWKDYPYTKVETEKEVMEHIEVKPSGNMYYYSHRCKIVEC